MESTRPNKTELIVNYYKDNEKEYSLDYVRQHPSFNWKVVGADSFHRYKGNLYAQPGKQHLVRSDSPDIVLGTQVGVGYEILQNKEMLDWLQPYIDRGYLSITGFGYFNYGQKIFIQSHNKFVKKVDGDDVAHYFLTLNHHGGGSFQVNFCTQRVVCRNTLDIASHQGNKIAIRHGYTMRDDMEMIHTRLNLAEEHFNDEVEVYRELSRKPMTREGFYDILCEEFSKELKNRNPDAQPSDYPIIQASLNNWDSLEDVQHLDNTAWKAFNSFNYNLNHGYNGVSKENAVSRIWNTGTYMSKIVQFKRLALK